MTMADLTFDQQQRPLLQEFEMEPTVRTSGNSQSGSGRRRFCIYMFVCILMVNLCLMIYWRYDVRTVRGNNQIYRLLSSGTHHDNSSQPQTPKQRTKWISKSKLGVTSDNSINKPGLIQHIAKLVGIVNTHPDDVKYRQYLCLPPEDHHNLTDLYKWFKPAPITIPAQPSRAFRTGAPPGFTVSTSYAERKKMLQLMEVFRDTLHAHNFTFLLYGGTSLGSYRHHGFVAWDDDIDVWIPWVYRDKIAQTLKKRDPTQYKVWTTSGTFQWKFYYANSPKIHTPWRWPYLDIFFYKENKTHVWDASKCCGYYHIGDVFPLRQIPFSGVTFPGPRNLPKFILDYYGNVNEQCKTTDFNHRKEYSKSQRHQTIACSRLHNYYPFVFRTDREGYVEESLRVADEEIYSIHVPKYCSG